MQSRIFQILTACLLAAVVAGCGGGSTSAPPVDPTDPTPPPPSAASLAKTLDAEVTKLETLTGADDAEGSALKMAKDGAAKLATATTPAQTAIGTLTLASDGNSKVAMETAKAVLDAKVKLEMAVSEVTKARKAVVDAKAAVTDTDMLALLDRYIEDADEALKAAKGILDATGADSLAGYIKVVTGDDEDDPQTATDRGKSVADAVMAALKPTASDNGAPVRAPIGTTAPEASVDKDNKYEKDDRIGKTWAAIVGAANLTKRQVVEGAPTGAATRTADVVSIAGMKVTDVFGTAASLNDTTGVPTDTDTEGAETTTTATNDTTNYMGIPGVVICGGDDCKAKDGKLTGSWLFTPTAANTPKMWMKVGDAKVYSEETLFASYGHWLTVGTGATAGQVTVNRFATSTINEAGDWGDNSALDGTATYSGKAAGRSVHSVTNTDGKVLSSESGRFEANVKLTATFGAGTNAKLKGTVDGFTSSDNPGAVDPNWKVTLDEKEGVTGALFSDGVAKASGQAGVWSATSYGESGKRPTGIFGGFNAHFTDGHAAGAYATRKD